jgi:hypothetical protein
VCLNLPWAWANILPPHDWDVPADDDPSLRSAMWQPGTWGGHSILLDEYDEVGPWVPHTWSLSPYRQRITWRGLAWYCDEAHLILDSVNQWKQERRLPSRTLDAIVDAINSVSSQKVVA